MHLQIHTEYDGMHTLSGFILILDPRTVPVTVNIENKTKENISIVILTRNIWTDKNKH